MFHLQNCHYHDIARSFYVNKDLDRKKKQKRKCFQKKKKKSKQFDFTISNNLISQKFNILDPNLSTKIKKKIIRIIFMKILKKQFLPKELKVNFTKIKNLKEMVFH